MSTSPIGAKRQIRQQSDQTINPARDPHPFKAFYSKFTKDEKKQFLDNMTRHFTLIITRHMRKMREANQRLKASIR
ncbi:MAG: hypothetical protein H7A38_06505 [Chlamydiales bacterium]|nr:hypothetical protein [Chlamydiales bacterium]